MTGSHSLHRTGGWSLEVGEVVIVIVIGGVCVCRVDVVVVFFVNLMF